MTSRSHDFALMTSRSADSPVTTIAMVGVISEAIVSRVGERNPGCAWPIALACADSHYAASG